MTELDVLREVDFNWARQLRSVWRDQAYSVSAIHQDVVEDVMAYFLRNTREPEPDNEPLGRVILGGAGHGKTHLVGELRRRVWEGDGTFILLDFVGVTDFWASAALGFLNSLQIRVDGRQIQYDRLIQKLISLLSLQSQLTEIAARYKGRPRELMAELVKTFITALTRGDRAKTQQHGDIIRALVMLISDDLECASIAHGWLQGMELDTQSLRDLGFVALRKPPIEIVRGLSWLLSLVGPTMIAVDQIDPIISEASIERRQLGALAGAEQLETQSIIEKLVEGLMGLHEVKQRAVTIISSLDVSWEVLKSRSTVAVDARYRQPTRLNALSQPQMAQMLVAARLTPAYATVGFPAPYETWPFAPEAFGTAVGFTPRQLLKACDDHRQRCIAAGEVLICKSFGNQPVPAPPPPPSDLQAMFERTRSAAVVDGLFEKANERRLADILAVTLDVYARQLNLPDDIDVASQQDPDQQRPSLHGRLTFTFRSEADREQHFCFRVISHGNAIAFQSRLRAAMTASGVDRALGFRHLFILRRDATPGGAKTKQLVEKFEQAGGKFVALSDDDLRTFMALNSMTERKPEGFDAWLRENKPLFETSLFRAAGLAPPAFLPSAPPPNGPGPAGTAADTTRDRAAATPSPAPSPRPMPGATASTSPHKPEPQETNAGRDIPLGHRYDRGTVGTPVKLAADLLPRHVAILAGSGSGKTVLLRRIVEEAALLGIPAIVLDTNNDLARLGDQWPVPPEGWTEEDAGKAARYGRNVDVTIWTPGRNAGRPMSLALLPDFAGLGDDEDERAQAIEMARATLAPFIGARGANAQLKEGVLADALRTFAREGGGSLERLIDTLSELPEEVSQIDGAPKLAAGMANLLRAAIATNPLLQSRGVPLDPEILFGTDPGRTRISVINFSGLASDEAKQSFVNQLQMSLFTWIKRHPSPTGRLLVLDEAQNFAPSLKTTPCKESTLALAAQARKYGLGMIFATQTPTGIDNKIVSNCTTHFYGRMSSPATIAATRGLLEAKGGGGGEDVARLIRGEFHFSTEAVPRPMRIRTPICLTWHPANPLTAAEVVERARRGE
ncbi:ATP-binding protein [Bradyrhizobium sp. Arg237L]|uniref:ATP-binding protein n=1 Tax=Bradyrhizobium sp. Arg237L TaxID=3003352 RepID=UPI00249E3151|nr:ATP-binding protein [Bradyrhizobium sp. Arg237L]MDI4231530.1 ATP-binding protein [Bradyrhizobium sp. Arg237L]